ncbi:MAG: glycerophosphodiester phosphodiesterase [Actinomycetota bacterium]
MEIVGHRGAAALAPENTLAAIEAGFRAGADAVEVDLRLSADGVLVLLHDLTVDRTTDGTGAVAAMTLAAIRALDAGARRPRPGPRPIPTLPIPTLPIPTLPIPTLEEAWELARGRIVLEIKGAWGTDEALRTGAALAGFLEGRDAAAAVASSFDIRVLAALRQAGVAIDTGVLTTAAFDAASNVAAAAEGGHAVCYLPDAVASEDAIRAVLAAGKRAAVWTVNDPDRIRALAAGGATAVLTDDPRSARAALRQDA